jgi:hypothetical protein
LRWVVLGVAAATFALVTNAAPRLLPVVCVGLWLAAAATSRRPGYLLLDTAAIGAVVAPVLLVAGTPVPLALVFGLVLLGALVLDQAMQRHRSGVGRAIGRRDDVDAVLIDLRDRARSHANLPVLPAGWHIEAELRSAHGDTFCGDFLVASRRQEHQLDLVLVDVSGNGWGAGSRALLFTGAFAALLEAVPKDQFLLEANRYVLRHGGEEGFATAVHATVDLRAGTFTVASAGHPPAAHFRAGSGRWELLGDRSGPLLGVMPDAAYGACSGTLAPGDALLLYTDGMVENRRLDVERGIDRLIGFADPVLAKGIPGGAALIAEALRAGEADDRALVVIRRSA